MMLVGFVIRTQSMEELDRQIHKGRFRKLLPQRQTTDARYDPLCAVPVEFGSVGVWPK